MRFELWLAPAGTEFIGKSAGGEQLCASEDGVQPAVDLTGFLMQPSFEIGDADDRDD